MKAFVFRPTNEYFGKFKIEDLDQIPAKLDSFLQDMPTSPLYSYVEAGGKAWTITELNPLTLKDGVVKPKPGGLPDAGDTQVRDTEKPVQNIVDTAKKNMVSGALWCIGGIIVTAVTYNLASNGGTYVVAWGAILFGGIEFLYGLAQAAGGGKG